MYTAKCPLCGCLHNVPAFDGEESAAVQCISCRGWFHFTERIGLGLAGSPGQYGTRVADRMNATPDAR